MSKPHECKWCGSDHCDALVVCDLCYEDISEAEPRYKYLPDHVDADDRGFVRICKSCYTDLTLDTEFIRTLTAISV